MRSCTDPHELYFHLQEVVYVTLVHQRGRVCKICCASSYIPHIFPFHCQIAPHQNGTPASSTLVPSTSNYSNYTSTTTTKVSNSDLAGVSATGVQIMRFMEAQPKHDEGIHVGAITRAVGKDAFAIRYVPLLSVLATVSYPSLLIQQRYRRAHGKRITFLDL